MNIGDAAAASGLNPKTIRFYEEIGLIAPAKRGRGGYREYDDKDVANLRFVSRARDLGFSIAEVSNLLSLFKNTNRTSSAVKGLTMTHLAGIDRKLEELLTMKRALEQLAESCEGGERPDCPILDELAGDRANAAPGAGAVPNGVRGAGGRAHAPGHARSSIGSPGTPQRRPRLEQTLGWPKRERS